MNVGHLLFLYGAVTANATMVVFALLLVMRNARRIEHVERVMSQWRAEMKEHDAVLIKEAGREFFDQVSKIMYLRAEDKFLGEPVSSLKIDKEKR